MSYTTTPARTGRNIGDLTRFVWDGSAAATALISGWSEPSLASPNGQTMTINRDGGGGVLITFGADTTTALIRTRINAGAGLSGLAIAGPGNQTNLEAATSLVVSGVSDTLFAKIGIPNTAIRSRLSTVLTTIQPTIAVRGDELDQISKPVTVPAGATHVAIYVQSDTLISDDFGNGAGIDFFLGTSNGSDGGNITTIYSPVLNGVLSGTISNRLTDSPGGYRKGYGDIVQQVGSVVGIPIVRKYIHKIDPTDDLIYLCALQSRSEDPAAPPPYTPPTMSAQYRFFRAA